MKTINFFETIEIITNKDIEVSDEFIPLNKDLFISTGKYEKSDRGAYELCTLKAGSRAFVSMTPNGAFYLTDYSNSNTCHAQIERKDFTLPPNTQFVNKLTPVPNKLGLFK